MHGLIGLFLLTNSKLCFSCYSLTFRSFSISCDPLVTWHRSPRHPSRTCPRPPLHPVATPPPARSHTRDRPESQCDRPVRPGVRPPARTGGRQACKLHAPASSLQATSGTILAILTALAWLSVVFCSNETASMIAASRIAGISRNSSAPSTARAMNRSWQVAFMSVLMRTRRIAASASSASRNLPGLLPAHFSAATEPAAVMMATCGAATLSAHPLRIATWPNDGSPSVFALIVTYSNSTPNHSIAMTWPASCVLVLQVGDVIRFTGTPPDASRSPDEREPDSGASEPRHCAAVHSRHFAPEGTSARA